MLSKNVCCPQCKKRTKIAPVPQVYNGTSGGKIESKVRYIYICPMCEYEWEYKR